MLILTTNHRELYKRKLFQLDRFGGLFFKKILDFCARVCYNLDTVKGNLGESGKRKGNGMNEAMTPGEIIREVTAENQTRKILEIMRECEDLEEAIKKVKALLNK